MHGIGQGKAPLKENKQLAELLKWLRDSGFSDTELDGEYTAFILKSGSLDLMINGKEFQFLAFDEIPEFYKMYKFSLYMPQALPFAMDGEGGFYVFDKRGKSNNSVYTVSAGNLGWQPDECRFLAEDFNTLIFGKFPN